MNTLKKILAVLCALAIFGVIALVDYGVKTQCPNVADNVYVKCFDY